MRLLTGLRLADRDDPAWIRLDGDRIAEIGGGAPPAGEAEAHDGLLALPGFVDLHCHGGGGGSHLAASSDEARRAAAAHLRRGTTTALASLGSAAPVDLRAQVEALLPLVDEGVLEGIHLEGPWLAPDHRGAHDPAVLRAVDPAELDDLLALGDGRIRMVTLAPEVAGALDAIPRIVAAGAVVAIGHTGADAATVRAAIDRGATVATHLFNAMPPLHHRAPGPVGALLADPRVTVELIADLVHVDPLALAIAIRAAGPERVALVTDAIAAADAGDGAWSFGGLDVIVADGVARLAGGGALAGSTLTQDAALRAVVGGVGAGVADAAAMLATTPARVLGLADRGRLAPGCRADLVLLDGELAVRRVIRAGVDAG
jgi:N-acetylglucosamine-6-phosphate deacetylase